MASAADAVVAQPGSLTGGIGVYADTLDASRYLRRKRASVTVFSSGAEPLTAVKSLSSRQRRELRALASKADAEMAANVAKGRGLSARALRHAGSGRAWQARRIGVARAPVVR